MTVDVQGSGSVEAADGSVEVDESAAQECFEQLAAVKDSILEGVITPW
ncbi:hypothetical protein [Kitasatospora sp. DSM 101779]|nr:hypothetical protein [Kitasatospora sp. DSM 101779]MCU7822125.1 hypothetical protein [Kitasatospora sp. DSM 101779]